MKSSGHKVLLRALASSTLARTRQEPALVVFSLALAAICLDYVLAPALNTVTPAVCSGLLLLLVLRRMSAEALEPATDAPIAPWRLLVFFTLHLSLTVIFGFSRNVIVPTPNLAIAAAKYLVLAPTIVLLPLAGWRRFQRLYRPEWMAAAIALLTFFPYRIFATAWPWYSQALGRAAYTLAQPAVSGLQYASLPFPILAGPKLDVSILFWCSGLEAVKLFQTFFALMLVIDWVAIDRRRALLGYFGGLGMMLAANVARITLLVIAGNVAPKLTMRYHVTAGWLFFALVLVVYILIAHNWLIKHPRQQENARAASMLKGSLPSTSQ